MKKFRIENDLIELFPEVKIGVLVCNGIDNHIKDEAKYEPWLRECEEISKKYFRVPEWTENLTIRVWRDAFHQFKTKKGARASIEALLKRVRNGDQIGTIIPLVDIYNGISLKYGLPIGGENIDAFEGDLRLTRAEGGEYFVTYGGGEESDPPAPGEVIYKDDGGAVCRCFNWRESVRTMLTEDTTNAFMIIETVEGERAENLDKALDEMAEMIKADLGGTVEKFYVDAANPEVVIEK